MSFITNLILSLLQEIKELKKSLQLIQQSKAERLKIKWMENNDALQRLYHRKHYLKTILHNSRFSNYKVKVTFYDKVSNQKKLAQRNYYNLNINCDGIK